MNFKGLAKTISEQEGGCENLSIAQISEVLKITLRELAKVPASEAMKLIEQYQACKSE